MTLLVLEFRITLVITSHISSNYRRTCGLSRNQIQLILIWSYIQCNTCSEYISILVISIHMLQIGSEYAKLLSDGFNRRMKSYICKWKHSKLKANKARRLCSWKTRDFSLSLPLAGQCSKSALVVL